MICVVRKLSIVREGLMEPKQIAMNNAELPGQSGPKPNFLTTADRPQQADFADAVSEARKKGQCWVNKI